ncbi:MAG: LLM class flavin-dependent oxidoreductase, partial [Chloroflexi bacterium]|nr:LLM class flavin-dependent oxidoreductase [Chloroflexota bacterium]
DGEVFHLPLPGGDGTSIRSGAPPCPNIPVYLATLSPMSLSLTGEVADGWLGTSFIPEQAEEVFFQHIRKGAQKAGRAMSDLDLQAGGVVSFGDDVEKMLPRRKPGLAFTLGAMGSKEHNFYNAAFQRAGYEEEARAIQRKWIEGDRQTAASMVPDEMVIKTNLLGTDAMVRERMQAYKDAGVTTLRIDPEGRSLQERLDTLGRAINLAKDV